MKYTAAIGILAIGCSTLIAAEAPATNSNAKPQPAAVVTNAAPDEIIAKGKGVKVMRSQLDESVATIKGSLRGQEVPAEQLQSIEPQLLDRLIGMQLITGKATDADKTAAGESTTKRIAEIQKNMGGEEALAAQLKTHGIAMDEFKSKLAEESLVETVLERELKIEITDAEAKKFYEENPSRFEEPEKVRAAHILLMTQDHSGNAVSDEKKKEKLAQIQDLLKRARAGEDFAKLAQEYSQDPGSKSKGGEYEFPRGQMVPEFEKAAFALGTNEVSEVVTTQYGYHIIKLHEKKPATKTPYEEASARIKEGLKAQAMQKQMPGFIAKLRADADVTILDESLKPKPVTDLAPPATSQPAQQPEPKPADKPEADKQK
jgi:peptidyl-prolyl cis-trans isomerase C